MDWRIAIVSRLIPSVAVPLMFPAMFGPPKASRALLVIGCAYFNFVASKVVPMSRT
jgi:hypothetical protein